MFALTSNAVIVILYFERMILFHLQLNSTVDCSFLLLGEKNWAKQCRRISVETFKIPLKEIRAFLILRRETAQRRAEINRKFRHDVP